MDKAPTGPSTPLLGIALVVGGHRRGSQLLFSYPEKQHQQQAAKTKAPVLDEDSAVMLEPRKEAVWGMSEDTFASMLCPKPALCNRRDWGRIRAA